jgi:MFS family permease
LITFFAVHAENNLLLSSSIIATLFGIKGAFNLISRIPSGKLTDRIGHKYPIVIAYTLLAIAFLLFSETSNLYLLAFAMIIYGAAHGMRAVAEWSLLGDSAPAEIRNIAAAYLSSLFNVGAAFGGVIAGSLSIIIDFQPMYKLASLIVLSGVILLILQRKLRK